MEAREEFWTLFVTHFKGRSTILVYELANEPAIPWSTPQIQLLWNKWNRKTTPIPSGEINSGDPTLSAYQHFREHLADEWTRRQVAVIKKADPDALVTIGLDQYSVPALGVSPSHYTGFRPERQAKLLDFMEVHFYPVAAGTYAYQSEAVKVANLAYLESVVREVGKSGLPTVLGEFGWYGGGSCSGIGGGAIVPTDLQQAEFCTQEVRTSTPFVCGWLNWAMYDDPRATDITRFSGLFTAEGKLKAWGACFGEISSTYRRQLPPVPLGQIGPRPDLPWDDCLTSSAAAEKFRLQYLAAYKREHFRS